MLCSERHSSETFSHKTHPHTAWPLGDCTSGQVLLRFSHFTLHTSHFALRTSHFTLRTSHFTLHTSHFTLRTSHFKPHNPNLTLQTSHLISPVLVALPPENNNCRPSESRSGLIHVMWPSTNASLWRQQFSFSVGQKCFGGRAAIVSRGRKSCIPVCGAGGSLDAESVKFVPITSQLLLRARGKINIMTERLM
ncbi:hypothetical protein F5882DRAFT_32832 [Hyaloscypha sp. PMI_1271]|nr:hypothetical protein F5882DRAFT_32832 [Hyaloscypha sp. PMI_1271]